MSPPARVGSRDPRAPASLAGFTAWHDPGENLLSVRSSCALIDFLHGIHLRLCQAVRSVAVLAEQTRRIEMAAARIVENPVFDAVNCIAGGVYRIADRL